MRTQNESHHDLHIANALKGVVHAPVGHLHQHLLDGLAVVLGVHKLCGSEFLCFLELRGVDVHANDPCRPGNLAAHNNSQANGSEAKYSARGTRLNLSVHKEENTNVRVQIYI